MELAQPVICSAALEWGTWLKVERTSVQRRQKVLPLDQFDVARPLMCLNAACKSHRIGNVCWVTFPAIVQYASGLRKSDTAPDFFHSQFRLRSSIF